MHINPWLWLPLLFVAMIFATVRINLLTERMNKQVASLESEHEELIHSLQEREAIVADLTDYGIIETEASAIGLRSPVSAQIVEVTFEEDWR
jgi:hypothetical protein